MKTKLLTCLATLLLATTSLTACGGATMSDEEWEEQYGVIVPEVKGLSKDYIMGMDVSSIIEVEEAGGVFYDWDGKEVDLFEFLADNGINYIRVRLWNDPYVDYTDPTSASFQGGGNDLETDIKIAKRAVDAGMKVCLDLHYSDFWADPDKQTAPRAWQNLVYYGNTEGSIIYAAAQWTTEVLQAFTDAGCEPSMVQVGNEINNGVCGYTVATWKDIFLHDCCEAVRNFDKNIKIVLHLAEGANHEGLSSRFKEFDDAGIDYDVMGLSYYSYWHGSIESFTDCINQLDKEFKHDICVMEYSYGWTDDYKEGSNQANIYSSDDEKNGGYKTSVQGQASYIHDVNEAVAGTKHGIGSFYWEPAWLPLNGTSWASDDAHAFLLAQNGAGGEGTTTWANQALFDFDGHPLNSLKAYSLMKKGGKYTEQMLEADTEVVQNINSAAADVEAELPTITTVFTSLDRWTEYTIKWDKSGVNELIKAETGSTVEIHGVASKGKSSFDVTGIFTLYKEYLLNPGFEESPTASDTTIVPGWEVEATSGAYRVESKNARSGQYNFNVWCEGAYTVNLYQVVNNLDAGTYELDAYFRSESGADPAIQLYATVNGVTQTTNVVYGAGWSDWVLNSVVFVANTGDSAEVGIKVTGEAEDWAHADDFTLATIA
ncbi:MAG: glycosyl hydrolase 53 family protein [Coprobacillus sp.]|nr:glycosyl hydrolase 53 family protein [Coprobacillus sp.]